MDSQYYQIAQQLKNNFDVRTPKKMSSQVLESINFIKQQTEAKGINLDSPLEVEADRRLSMRDGLKLKFSRTLMNPNLKQKSSTDDKSTIVSVSLATENPEHVATPKEEVKVTQTFRERYVDWKICPSSNLQQEIRPLSQNIKAASK